MKSDIDKLYSISQKFEKKILGLMSGTSLDGLDIALCTIQGNGKNTTVQLDNFTTIAYEEDFKKEVRKIFSVQNGDIELLTILHSFIGKYHGQLINQCLDDWKISNESIDLIASHGQTIYHAPRQIHKRQEYGNATLQLGDADHLAVETGIITISDFRLKHIAAGGEGAPLAVYGDYLLFTDAVENRILLNIGGIANFTWLPNDEFEINNPCFSSDVGPGNTMMDVFVQQNYGQAFDADGMIASKGKCDEQLLKLLLNHPFFEQGLPKTIGPELFNSNYLNEKLAQLNKNISHEDILATLNVFSATAISKAIQNNIAPWKDSIIYMSGGGMYNQTLVNHLTRLLSPMSIKSTIDLGLNPDAKEAMLFALLANECVSGDGLHLKNTIDGVPDISMGKVSFPG